MQEAQQLLEHAYQALSKNDFDRGNQCAEEALALMPNSADTLHMMALARKAIGNIEETRSYFYKSLAIKQDLQVLKNLISFLDVLKEYDEKLVNLNMAISLAPNDPALHIYRGMCLKELDQLDEAIVAYDRALELKPGDLSAIHNKGVVLRLKMMPEEALECYKSIFEQGKSSPELRYNIGCAYYDMGQMDEAEKELLTALGLRPSYVDAHNALNKLYWEHDNDDKFLRSFEVCMAKVPTSGGLRMAYAQHLEKADKEDEAEIIIKNSIAELGRHPDFLTSLGALRARKSDYETAKSLTMEALDTVPNSARYRLEMANYLIREQDYKGALDHLAIAEKTTPFDQEIWAYKGICWRFLGDEREHWLNDYDRFVQGHFLTPPEGYDNLEHFLAELKVEMEAMHQTGRHPLDQSLRGGTQTTSFLLGHPSKVIQDYRGALTQCVDEYLASLPTDKTHPFLKRIGNGFKFAGSWSVRLKSEGFHVNHMHPQGWLSGPTYIEVPKEISPDDPTRAGWVKFGETCLGLGDDEYVAKAICPEPGLVAFFPSYMWHGTFPFSSDTYRMTAPCDIMPL